MKSILFVSLAMLPITLPQAPAQSATTPVELTFASRVVSQYNFTRSLLTRLAEKMPAEHYAFQPAPEMRTMAAHIGHLAMSNINQCGLLLERKHELAGQDLSKTITTKAEAVKALADAHSFCDEYFLALKADGPLMNEYFSTFQTREGQKSPIKIPKASIVTSYFMHNNEMYGYMAVYLRLKGIVPPSSEPAPARGGGPAPSPR
jgi:hypothetical protein